MKDGLMRFLILLTVLAAVAVRAVQLLLFYDADTGFTTDGGWLSGVLLGLAALGVLLPYLRTEGNDVFYPKKQQLFCGVAASAAGCGLVAGACMAALQGAPAVEVMSFSLLTRGAYVFYLVASALAGISLLYVALCYFGGWRPFENIRWLCLFPVLAMGAKALYLFAVYTPEDSAFVNLLNLGALALLLGFFTHLGRGYADGQPTGSLKPLLLYASGAAVVGLASSVPNLLCWLLGIPCVQSADIPHLLAVGGVSVYALAVALGAYVRDRSRHFRRPVARCEQKVDNFAQELSQNE